MVFVGRTRVEEAKFFTGFHHDFEEFSILELNDTGDCFYHLYLCVPAKDDYKGKMVLLVEEDNQKYQPLYELSLNVYNNYHHSMRIMSEKELFENVRMFCFLVDIVLSYSYGDGFNLKKELMSMREPVRQNFLLGLTTISCGEFGDLIRSGDNYYGVVIRNTYENYFINNAYTYYMDNKDSINTGNSDFFFRLLVSLVSLKYCHGMFSANTIINPCAYGSISSREVINNSIGFLDDCMDSHMRYELFVNNVYYRSVTSLEVFERILSDSDDNGGGIISSLNYYENQYFNEYDADYDDNHYKLVNYGFEPENINNIALNLVKIQDKVSIVEYNDYSHHYISIKNKITVKDVNSSLAQLWSEAFPVTTIDYPESLSNKVQDSTIEFLYHSNTLKYFNHPLDMMREMYDKLNMVYDYDVKLDKDSISMVKLTIPYIVYQSNDYFDHNIDNHSMVNYVNFCTRKAFSSKNFNYMPVDSDCVVLSVVLPILSNKFKMQRFVQLYPYLHDYIYSEINDCVNEVSIIEEIISDDVFSDSIISGNVTFEHLVNILTV